MKKSFFAISPFFRSGGSRKLLVYLTELSPFLGAKRINYLCYKQIAKTTSENVAYAAAG
jgi:hypothetical protein